MYHYMADQYQAKVERQQAADVVNQRTGKPDGECGTDCDQAGYDSIVSDCPRERVGQEMIPHERFRMQKIDTEGYRCEEPNQCLHAFTGS